MTFYQNYIGKLKKLVDRDQGVPDKNMFGADQDIILEQIAEEEWKFTNILQQISNFHPT